MAKRLSLEWRGMAWAVFATLNFSIMGVLIKKTLLLFPFHSTEIAFWRTLLSFLAIGATLVAQGRYTAFKTPHFWRHINRSAAGTLSLILFFYAIGALPLGTTVTLSYTSSIFLALFSFLFLKERIAKLTVSALFLGLFGVAVVLRPEFDSGQLSGQLAALGSGALAGWAYLQVRELSLQGEPAWRIVFYFAFICTLACAVVVSFQGWHLPAPASFPYLLAIGATALIAQMALTRAYALGPKFSVSAMSYLTVIFSALLAFVFLGERMGATEILGMGIIITAGILSALPAKGKTA